MEKITLKCKKVVGGKAAGEAIVCHEPISFIGGVDPNTGYVIEKGHELEGKKITGKVLVYPTGKGSTGGSYRIYEMAYQKTAPVAFVLIQREAIVTVGCIMGDIPCIDGLEKDPTEVIKDGDFVEVDADNGTIIINRNFAKEKL
jgi:predicted aconitase with swiveling domain